MVIINFSFCFYLIFLLFFLTLILLLISMDHFIIILIFLDLLLLINILLFIVGTTLTENSVGYNYALIILGLAASDTAVALGLVIIYFKATENVSINNNKF